MVLLFINAGITSPGTIINRFTLAAIIIIIIIIGSTQASTAMPTTQHGRSNPRPRVVSCSPAPSSPKPESPPQSVPMPRYLDPHGKDNNACDGDFLIIESSGHKILNEAFIAVYAGG